MAIRIYNPFVELARFDNTFRNLFEQNSFNLDNFYAPVVDVEESHDGFDIQMNIPGIKPDELIIEATSDEIEIKAESKIESSEDKKDSENTTEELPRRFRKASRKYYKKIHFNVPIDPNTGKVSLKDGVLSINIQKRPEAKRITLNIE